MTLVNPVTLTNITTEAIRGLALAGWWSVLRLWLRLRCVHCIQPDINFMGNGFIKLTVEAAAGINNKPMHLVTRVAVFAEVMVEAAKQVPALQKEAYKLTQA